MHPHLLGMSGYLDVQSEKASNYNYYDHYADLLSKGKGSIDDVGGGFRARHQTQGIKMINIIQTPRRYVSVVLL
jgi:hypothetical protein